MSDIVWQDPPVESETPVEVVARQLRANPGRWALVASVEGIQIMPWYGPLIRDADFETRRVVKTDTLFGATDIYMRFKESNDDS